MSNHAWEGRGWGSFTGIGAAVSRYPRTLTYVLFFLLAVASRPAHLRGPTHEDTGGYLYVGERILEGGAPYVDAAEPKGPVTHLLFAAIRLVSGHSATAVRLTMLLFIALAALLLAGYVARYAGRAAGLVAGGLLATLTSMPEMDGQYPNTEHYGLAFIVGAVALAGLGSPRAAAGAGALAVAATLMNLAFVIVFVLVGIELVQTRGGAQRWSRIAAAAVGGVAVALILAVWLGAYGALDDVKVQFWDYARDVANGRAPQIAYVDSRLDPEWLFEVPALPLWLAGITGSTVAMTDRRLRAPATLSLVWIVAMWVRIKLLSSFSWPHHYLLVLPGISAGLALGVASFWGEGARRRVAIAALVLVTPLSAYVVDEQRRALNLLPAQRWDSRFIEAYPMADFIRTHTRPDDKIFVAGSEGEVYWLADRKAPTRHAMNYVIWLAPEYAKERAEDLRRDPPAAIAVIEPETLTDVADDVQRLVDSGGYKLAYQHGPGKIWLRR